jgi:hypothetical protein
MGDKRMDTSIFLAKALGLYFIIFSIILLINSRKIQNYIIEMSVGPFMLFSGMIALIIGILMVVSHNVWESDWRVAITLIGWIILIKGIVRLLFPEYSFRMVKDFVENTVAFYITDVLILILGLWLAYMGFMSS